MILAVCSSQVEHVRLRGHNARKTLLCITYLWLKMRHDVSNKFHVERANNCTLEVLVSASLDCLVPMPHSLQFEVSGYVRQQLLRQGVYFFKADWLDNCKYIYIHVYTYIVIAIGSMMLVGELLFLLVHTLVEVGGSMNCTSIWRFVDLVSVGDLKILYLSLWFGGPGFSGLGFRDSHLHAASHLWRLKLSAPSTAGSVACLWRHHGGNCWELDHRYDFMNTVHFPGTSVWQMPERHLGQMLFWYVGFVMVCCAELQITTCTF